MRVVWIATLFVIFIVYFITHMFTHNIEKSNFIGNNMLSRQLWALNYANDCLGASCSNPRFEFFYRSPRQTRKNSSGNRSHVLFVLDLESYLSSFPTVTIDFSSNSIHFTCLIFSSRSLSIAVIHFEHDNACECHFVVVSTAEWWDLQRRALH